MGDNLMSFFGAVMKGPYLLLGVLAILFSVIAIFILLSLAWQFIKGDRVDMRVVANHEVRKEKDGEIRIRFKPEFEIVGGELAGIRGLGNNANNPPTHDVGEFVSGFYNEQSDGTPYMSSRENFMTGLKMAGIVIFMAALMWFFVITGLKG